MINSLKLKQDVVFDSEARKGLLEGAEVLYKAVKTTMGPSGKNIIIDRGNQLPQITKDGVTVARAINLRKKLPSIGAELLKEVASKTNENAGDGPQPLYAKILTPNGWTTMGELKLGDEICGTNNTIQTVLEIHPKGQKSVIQISTFDGRVIECCEDHLWLVKTHYCKEKVISTKQMMEDFIIEGKTDRRFKYFLPLISVDFKNNKNLPLDPYLVGTLLGDGSLSKTVELSIGLKEEYILDNLVLPKNCIFTKFYDHKKNYIRVKFKNIEGGKSTLKKELKDLGLLGTNSYNKFIPKIYLTSSILNRKKLLEGLIDTDGYINQRGLFEYSTVSEQLYLDFIELCRSLGIQVNGRKKERKINSSYSNKPIYFVSQLKGYKNGIKIKNIEKLNKKVEMQCIKVSNKNHLYISNDYLPTHNTTTATVLAFSLLKEGHKLIEAGANPILFKQGMDLATRDVLNSLKSIPVRNEEDIINIGTISANGDKTVGRLIASAIKLVGPDGIITIEPTKSFNTSLEVVEGMQVESGYVSPYFITNQEKNIAELENPYVLITNRKISNLQDLIPILEAVANENRSLLVIGDEIEGEALHSLIVNKMKEVLKCCAIKAPGFGDYRIDLLHDMGLLTQGTVLDAGNENSLKKLTTKDLGTCKKIIVSRTTATFLCEEATVEVKQKLQKRIEDIKGSLNEHLTDNQRVSQRKRLAKLAGGIAVIRVGGSSEPEIFEKKDRVEDALNATIAAVQEGIIPGGGTALFKIAGTLEKQLEGQQVLKGDKRTGYLTVLHACKEPLRTIVENTGKSSEIVCEKLEQATDQLFSYGYDASTEQFGDLIQLGIIDPVKVAKHALQHASSVVGTVLTSGGVIMNENESELTISKGEQQ